jgi:trigger factor
LKERFYNMKKRMISLLLVAAMAFSAAACGGKSADKDSSKSESGQEEAAASKELSATDVAGMDVTQYVELGDYKDLEVKLEGDYAEDEDALNAYIDDMLTASYEKDDTYDQRNDRAAYKTCDQI